MEKIRKQQLEATYTINKEATIDPTVIENPVIEVVSHAKIVGLTENFQWNNQSLMKILKISFISVKKDIAICFHIAEYLEQLTELNNIKCINLILW